MADGNHGFCVWAEYFGKPVSLNDRFETVLIWSLKDALKNEGRWTPKEISQQAYQKALVFQTERKQAKGN